MAKVIAIRRDELLKHPEERKARAELARRLRENRQREVEAIEDLHYGKSQQRAEEVLKHLAEARKSGDEKS